MISAIIPVYNAERYLPRMLMCLVAQTEQDFEVLLVDDGSSDSSGEICDKMMAKGGHFRCIHQTNAGVSAARNRGLAEAKGEYITFLDADDMVDPWYFATLLATCEDHDADIAVCDVALERGGEEKLRFTLPEQKLTQTEALDFLLTRRYINSGPCAKLFRRAVLSGLMFPPLRAYEDILFVKDAFCRAAKIAVTDQTAYHYIENADGAMSDFSKAPSLDIVRATDALLNFLRDRKDLSPKCFYITASHLMQYVQPMLPCPKPEEMPFLNAARKLYRDNWLNILKCSGFYWKEKVVYLAFAAG